MIAEEEPAGQGCRTCAGRGWRWIRSSRAEAEFRIDGRAAKPVRVRCFDCPDVVEVAA
ncbi:hypothetical protein GCM10017673_36120 [Streptosporangium violaceochromogenes]|nr:hypothetical protein GCM10017673_36120 [Streptosporangium violaceochromogenes]